jgi:hypothetical protein
VIGPDGVTSHRELANLLTEGMRRRSRPAVKTFLIERARHDRPIGEEMLRTTLRPASPRRRVQVTRLADAPQVFLARVGALSFWIDTAGDPFWAVHTVDQTQAVNGVIERWVATSSELDQPWFPKELLQEMVGSGEFVGFGLTYSGEYFADEPDTAETLSFRVSGTDARVALSDLQRHKTFERTSALSMVRLRQPFDGPGPLEASRVTVTLTSRGRVSTRGDSFDRHNTFFRVAAGLYERMSASIAGKLSVGGLQPDGGGLRGAILLDLVSPIDNLASFCGRVFSGADPFLLWGFLERRSDSMILVQAFDRRVGEAFVVEATPSQWRIYLPDGAPGSIALRLLTLLQHQHDQRVHMPALSGLLS